MIETTSYRYVAPLGAPGVECGTKGDRLAAVAALGLNVPMTYVLPSATFAFVLRHNGLARATDIHPDISLPEALVNEVHQIYDEAFAGEAVVVRSSSTGEDSPFASCAGQYDTYLNLRSFEAVLEAVRRCYVSLVSPDAQAYLELHGRDPDLDTMPVLIQRMVEPDQAGVLFTRHIHDPEQMQVEYIDGLGVGVVSGTGIPKRVQIGRSAQEGSTPGLHRALRDTGLVLEERFGRPQDIEWGWCDGALYVFQSRDIASAPQVRVSLDRPAGFRATLAGDPISYGVGIGPLVPLSRSADAPDGYLLLLDGRRGDSTVRAIARSCGVVVLTHGVLSHVATVIREIRKPAIAVARLPEADGGEPFVLDANNGVLGILGEQDSVVRKQLVYEAYRSAASEPATASRFVDHVEGVSLEPAVVQAVHRSVGGAGRATFIGVQTIVPFDMPERVYCGISARCQVTGSSVRLQIKRVVPDAGAAPYRHDEEILTPFDNVEAARAALLALGYQELDTQHRVVEIYHHGGCKVQFNYWPGSGGVYLGVEAADEATVRRLLAELDVDQGALRSIDGVEIFDWFGLERSTVHFDHWQPVGLELD